MTYVYLIKQSGNAFSAYVPDLPGCVATGKTHELAEKRIREAITWHVEALTKETIPDATVSAGLWAKDLTQLPPAAASVG